MLISCRWLARHVDLAGLTAEELANDLTLHTAEVEGVERFAPWLSDVVVGEVVVHEPHPDADRLSLCRVDVGDGEPLSIVCGAQNVARGQKVAVARVGTVLPGDLKLKKTRIRGVDSCGMICSERELGLGEDREGIWVLAPEAQVGLSVAQALGAEDWVIEIDNKSLTHRPDLWGHRGIAGEIAAIRKRELRPLDLALPKTAPGEPYPVRVETAGCSRYLALAIDGARVEPSPAWLKLLLLAAGQRPLGLMVDLSNFVMLDLAQPNHLFDRRRLAEDGILVRDPREGERIRTLDGVERVLARDDMLICSGDDPVAIAGVMGGEKSAVEADTTELLLEVATFHPTRVRRTAARLGLRTEASTRFEKSLDPTLPAKAAAHLVRLLAEIQPRIRLPRPIGDAGRWTDPARPVELRPARARNVLGKNIDDEEIAATLQRLGFAVERAGTPWKVFVPSARATKDIAIEEDLVEEIGRMHGYGRIQERPLVGAILTPPRDERRALVRDLQDRLAGAACFHEAMTHTLQPTDVLQHLGALDDDYVRVQNPIHEGADRVRRSVLPSLLAVLAHNRRHRSDVRLFEIGKGYRAEHANERGEPQEVHELALVWALPPPASAARKSARFDADALARLKGVVEDLARAVGRRLPGWERIEPGEAPRWAHPNRSMFARAPGAARADGENAVRLGALEPRLRRELGLEGELESDVACAEISIDAWLALEREPFRYRPIPRYPGVKLDVAIAIPEKVLAGEVKQVIERAGKGQVESVELFDLYRGEGIGAGKKSLAFHVLLQAEDRTLTDADEAKFLARLERAVAELGGELRKE